MNALNGSRFKVLSYGFVRCLLGALLFFPGAVAEGGEEDLISISRDGTEGRGFEIRFVGVLQSADTRSSDLEPVSYLDSQ